MKSLHGLDPQAQARRLGGLLARRDGGPLGIGIGQDAKLAGAVLLFNFGRSAAGPQAAFESAELIDKITIQAVEDAFGCGYPRDAEAVLLIVAAQASGTDAYSRVPTIASNARASPRFAGG